MDWSYILSRTFIKCLSQEAKDALQEYTVEAVQKFKSYNFTWLPCSFLGLSTQTCMFGIS